MKRKALGLSLLTGAAALMLQAPSFAYTLDQANHTITLSPSSTSSATTKDILNAFTWLAGRADKTTRYRVNFNPGKYSIAYQINSSDVQNVDLVSNPSNPAKIVKDPAWSSTTGEFIFFTKNWKSISMAGFEIYGLTTFANGPTPVWPDQGMYFGSVQGLTVDNNKFYNFGNAALRTATYEKDPVAGVNTMNIVVSNNLFNNFYQISTTTNDFIHGGVAHYTLKNNTFVNVRGSVKFASRTKGAMDVHLLNNTINGGDHYGFEIDNYNDFEIGGNTIQNVKEFAMNIYTNNRTQADFQWGDNFNIHGNKIQNCGYGIRFSPDKEPGGMIPVPHNLIVDGNTIDTLTSTATQPAIALQNNPFSGVKLTSNVLNNIANKKYISVVAGSTNVSQMNNMVDGLAYGPQGSNPSPSPAPSPSPTPTPTPTPTASVPAAPTSLTGSYASSAVKLNWTDNATNETSVEVWSGTDGVHYTLASKLGANTTSYSQNVSTAGTRYYAVRTVNSKGVSAFAKTSVKVTTATASVSSADTTSSLTGTVTASEPAPTQTATEPSTGGTGLIDAIGSLFGGGAPTEPTPSVGDSSSGGSGTVAVTEPAPAVYTGNGSTDSTSVVPVSNSGGTMEGAIQPAVNPVSTQIIVGYKTVVTRQHGRPTVISKVPVYGPAPQPKTASAMPVTTTPATSGATTSNNQSTTPTTVASNTPPVQQPVVSAPAASATTSIMDRLNQARSHRGR